MKIAVISDSHYDEAINDLRPYIDEVDMILHCGDGVPDLEYLTEGFSGEVYGVKGNCDISREYPSERIIDVKGKKIFMCHGHQYNVKYGYDKIFYKGKEVGADIILFGHSHIGVVEECNGVILMNPGSVTITHGRVPKSLGYIEINDEGNIRTHLELLDR